MPSRQVLIPASIQPYPSEIEVSAATLLACHFNADVTFRPRNNYPTADFLIKGTVWELKSPTGNGKRTIQRNLQNAMRQSDCIIYDLRRSKMNAKKAIHDLGNAHLKEHKIKRLLVIMKSGNMIELVR